MLTRFITPEQARATAATFIRGSESLMRGGFELLIAVAEAVEFFFVNVYIIYMNGPHRVLNSKTYTLQLVESFQLRGWIPHYFDLMENTAYALIDMAFRQARALPEDRRTTI